MGLFDIWKKKKKKKNRKAVIKTEDKTEVGKKLAKATTAAVATQETEKARLLRELEEQGL